MKFRGPAVSRRCEAVTRGLSNRRRAPQESERPTRLKHSNSVIPFGSCDVRRSSTRNPPPAANGSVFPPGVEAPVRS